MSESTKLGQKLPWKFKTYALALFIFSLSESKYLITNYYQPYLFKPLSGLQRLISGKIPFAIGEWVYIFIVISLIISLIKKISQNKLGISSGSFWRILFIQILNGILQFYIVFELCWGLNYQMQSPAHDFKMETPSGYSEFQMDSLSLNLIGKLNETRSKIGDTTIDSIKFDTILAESKVQYADIATQFPFLKYPHPSIKTAIFQTWGDYIGFTAFYQPFTGEAIIRGDLPKLTLPFTICHEIAHQLGYASETEANFIAFVVGVESKHPLFQYSTQLQIFSYAQQAHLLSIAKRGDTIQFQKIIARNKQMLNPKVLADRKMIKDFFLRRQDLQIPGTTQLYNQFLLLNKQAKGIESYNDVLLWVLAYKKRNA